MIKKVYYPNTVYNLCVRFTFKKFKLINGIDLLFKLA
jgi:hypothetical protein